jgi:hypothetical protein
MAKLPKKPLPRRYEDGSLNEINRSLLTYFSPGLLLLARQQSWQVCHLKLRVWIVILSRKAVAFQETPSSYSSPPVRNFHFIPARLYHWKWHSVYALIEGSWKSLSAIGIEITVWGNVPLAILINIDFELFWRVMLSKFQTIKKKT